VIAILCNLGDRKTPEREGVMTGTDLERRGSGPTLMAAPSGVDKHVAPSSMERVDGTVVEVDGRLVSDADVAVEGAKTKSDLRGEFAFEFPLGEVEAVKTALIARKLGHGTAQRVLDPAHLRGLVVVLPPAAEVRGMVLGADGPVEGATVLLRDGAVEELRVTGRDGAFQFPEARTGGCQVVVTARGFLPGHAQVAPGVGPRQVRIMLRPTADVALRIL